MRGLQTPVAWPDPELELADQDFRSVHVQWLPYVHLLNARNMGSRALKDGRAPEYARGVLLMTLFKKMPACMPVQDNKTIQIRLQT
jgi:hypothetical protein